MIFIGDRVQIAPHLDRWIRGDRYGVVKSVKTRLSHSGTIRHIWTISMNRSGDVIQLDSDHITTAN